MLEATCADARDTPSLEAVDQQIELIIRLLLQQWASGLTQELKQIASAANGSTRPQPENARRRAQRLGVDDVSANEPQDLDHGRQAEAAQTFAKLEGQDAGFAEETDHEPPITNFIILGKDRTIDRAK